MPHDHAGHSHHGHPAHGQDAHGHAHHGPGHHRQGHHAHPPPHDDRLSARFRLATLINAGFVLVELVAGLLTGSLALLADAAHNAMDVAGLLLAWGADAASRRPRSATFTYGFGRATILAALANAASILVGVGAVLWAAVMRFQEPVVVASVPMLAIAAIGIVVNGGTALLFAGPGHAHDLNARGAYLHMMADAAVSLGVVVTAIAMMTTGWALLDPLAAIAVSLAIALPALRLLRGALRLGLDGTPEGVDSEAVARFLAERPGVRDVHDLHVWALSTTRNALTAHLVMPAGHPGDGFLAELGTELAARFAIAHVAVQIELGDGPGCRCGAVAA